ncbi:C40 family peptidase [Alphaproteobacteria bacterium]|nr:C40 family peptidase [Alphaproteobacteria bacterium]
MNQHLKQISVTSTPLRPEPKNDSLIDTECLFGESIEIIKYQENYAFCKCVIDNYTGWIKASDMEDFRPKTHKILSLRSFLYETPQIKSNTILEIPFGSLISARLISYNWAEVLINNNLKGFIPAQHIIDVNEKIFNWVDTALKFLNTPYKWGGRNSKGIDCSALIQLSLQTAGINIPRDTKDQEKMEWEQIPNLSLIDKGVLIFWKGHVGVMIDNKNLLHANATSMSVIIESLDKVIKRHIKNNIGPISRMIKFKL